MRTYCFRGLIVLTAQLTLSSDSQSDWDRREASIFPLLPLGVFVPPEQTATQILSIKKKKKEWAN